MKHKQKIGRNITGFVFETKMMRPIYTEGFQEVKTGLQIKMNRIKD
jgi:hypothetical protein